MYGYCIQLGKMKLNTLKQYLNNNAFQSSMSMFTLKKYNMYSIFNWFSSDITFCHKKFVLVKVPEKKKSILILSNIIQRGFFYSVDGYKSKSTV